MDTPDVWRWIWLVATGVFAVGELATAGSFFLLPFAVGAGVAAIAAFAGGALWLEWLLFIAVSVASVAALRPLANRLDEREPAQGIGARRWIGQHAKVIAEIPAGHDETGLVRAGREQWRAASLDGTAIPAGAAVRVVDVTGTRLVVWPDERAALPDRPPTPRALTARPLTARPKSTQPVRSVRRALPRRSPWPW